MGDGESRFSLTAHRLCDVDRSTRRGAHGPSLCDMVLLEPAAASCPELMLIDRRVPDGPRACWVSTQWAHQYDSYQVPKPSHSTSGEATRPMSDQKPGAELAAALQSSRLGVGPAHTVSPEMCLQGRDDPEPLSPLSASTQPHSLGKTGLQPYVLPSPVTYWGVIKHHVFFFFFFNLLPAILKMHSTS